MRNQLLLVVSVITFVWLPTASAAEVLQTFAWPELKASGQLSAGEVLPAEPPEKGEILKIENPQDRSKKVKLLEIKDPGITDLTYAIRGRIRYENVKGRSYLEMWNYFPDDSHYFSRTLGNRGLLKHLEGTSAWRPFALPFSIEKETAARPNRLVVNLVFEGSGTVYLTPPRLEQYANAEEVLGVHGAWWGERTGGVIGGILGTVLGLLGGLIGTLGGRGRARTFVMALMAAIVFFGCVLLVAGAFALLVGQPYAVWYPMLLCGVISTLVCGSLRPVMRRRYEQRELERISKVDLGKMSE